MIFWVHLAMQEWGRQRRRILLGGRWYSNALGVPVFHADGFPRSNSLARLGEGLAPDFNANARHFPEGLVGRGLLVGLALKSCPERIQQISYVHYIISSRYFNIPEKTMLLGYWTVKEYYQTLHQCHQAVGSLIPPDSGGIG